MHSLRTKITLVTLALLAIAVSVVAALSVFFVRNDKQLETNQLLLLLCETGEQNLDYYFDRSERWRASRKRIWRRRGRTI